MSYQVIIQPAAQRQIRKLDKTTQKLIAHAIRKLVGDPRPRGCKKLKGSQDLYRVRVGDDDTILSATAKMRACCRFPHR